MELRKVAASRRTGKGRGPASRLRSTGQIPAVAYGKQLEAQSLAVSPEDVKAILGTQHGANTVVSLNVEGKEEIVALLTDYQYHPLSRELLHADFIQVFLDKPVNVEVPLELVGKPAGVVKGGTLRQVFRNLPVRCLPGQIPVKISHNITELDLDGHVAPKDLSLPEGVAVRLPPEQTLVAIVKEARGEEEAAGPGAPGAAGAAPAAAAGDKKAAAAPAAAAAAGDKKAAGGDKKPAGGDKKK